MAREYERYQQHPREDRGGDCQPPYRHGDRTLPPHSAAAPSAQFDGRRADSRASRNYVQALGEFDGLGEALAGEPRSRCRPPLAPRRSASRASRCSWRRSLSPAPRRSSASATGTSPRSASPPTVSICSPTCARSRPSTGSRPRWISPKAIRPGLVDLTRRRTTSGTSGTPPRWIMPASDSWAPSS